MLPLRTRFGQAVRRLRKQAGYSQEGFADAAGVHRTFMSTVERGLANISLDSVERIAAALGIPVAHVFLEADRSAPAPPDASKLPDTAEAGHTVEPRGEPPDPHRTGRPAG